jgi:hypothetical protein
MNTNLILQWTNDIVVVWVKWDYVLAFPDEFQSFKFPLVHLYRFELENHNNDSCCCFFEQKYECNNSYVHNSGMKIEKKDLFPSSFSHHQDLQNIISSLTSIEWKI